MVQRRPHATQAIAARRDTLVEVGKIEVVKSFGSLSNICVI